MKILAIQVKLAKKAVRSLQLLAFVTNGKKEA
jgi:hypothetical protein